MKSLSKVANVFLLATAFNTAFNIVGCEERPTPVQTETVDANIEMQIEAQIQRCHQLDQHGVKMMSDIFDKFRRDTNSRYEIAWDEEDAIYKAFIPLNAPKGGDWTIVETSSRSLNDAVKWQEATRDETSCALKRSLSFKEQFEKIQYYYKARSMPSYFDRAVASKTHEDRAFLLT
jgi:hypothetical protein